MSSQPGPVSTYDWAVTENLQPEPITAEVWRQLPEEFYRQADRSADNRHHQSWQWRGIARIGPTYR